MNDSVFRQRISSVMTDNMYERRVRGRTRGDLDMKSLYKVGTGSRNVFSQKMARKGKQYNIVLLVDESGSMGHAGWGAYKIDKAADCAVYLCSAFEGLNINVAVVGFNGKIHTHKEFGIKANLPKMRQEIIDRANGDSGFGRTDISCNHDFDGLAQAYKMLYNNKGTNLVIAMSDGSPNCDGNCYQDVPYDQDKHRYERIKALIHDNERVAKTIGVGVLYEARQFPVNILINDLDELKTGVANVLKKEIKRA